MQNYDPSLHDPSANEYSSGAGCLTRLYWMFAGNALLAMLLFWLAFNQPKIPAFQDVVYFLTLASLVAVRYIDICHFKGETGIGGIPSTMVDWRKYSFFLVTGCTAAWLAVRLALPLFVKPCTVLG